MPTSHTRVTIYNLALDTIGEIPIATLNDPSAYARWLNRNYAHTVETALRQNPWNFAIETHELAAEPSPPSKRFRYCYGLPPGWLRVLPPSHNSERYGRPLPYEVVGNKLYMQAQGPLPVRLVMNKQEPGSWDSLFAAVVAARLAVGMAQRFTRKASYTDLARAMAAEALETALEANAIESPIDPVEEFDIIRVRGGYDTGRYR